ncbi:MAG TPA: helix-turn-helix domain-containing protein [Thermoleophilaceae bacterium]|nr:helix-turn-helix domain-containing protein [Thermoleophilaceae bacterium]
MPPIGETLREARMRQKLDIADVEERTKIRAKYLRALENEEWGLLPGPTFVKTFLRTYAEVVGVDPYLLVEEYRLTEERTDAPEFQALAPMPARDRGRDRGRGGRRPPQRPPRRGGLIAGAVVLVVVGFLLVLGLTGGEDDSGGGGEQAATTQTTTTKQQPKAKQRQKQPAPTGVNVKIAPIEPTYVCVDNGAGTPVVFENTLDAARTFRNPQQVRINLGKRSAVVSLNGKPVAVQESAEPIALDLNRDGSSELDAAEAPCA